MPTYGVYVSDGGPKSSNGKLVLFMTDEAVRQFLAAGHARQVVKIPVQIAADTYEEAQEAFRKLYAQAESEWNALPPEEKKVRELEYQALEREQLGCQTTPAALPRPVALNYDEPIILDALIEDVKPRQRRWWERLIGR